MYLPGLNVWFLQSFSSSLLTASFIIFFSISRREIENHATNCKIHNDLINTLKTSDRIKREDLTHYTTGKIDTENVITARAFAGIYVGIADLGASLNSIPHMMKLIKNRYHVEIGEHCKSPTTITNIVHSISKSMHTRLCNHIKNSKLPIVVIFDGSTDRGKCEIWRENWIYWSLLSHWKW